MGQCYGKSDPHLIQRTGEAPLPFVQVDPVNALPLLPPPRSPSLVKVPPQQHSLPAKKSKGPQRRPVPPPKPPRSTQTKLSTAAALSQEVGVEATIHQVSVDNLHHHSMDEGYGTMDRADGNSHSRVCSPPIPPTVLSAPIKRMDVVPSNDDTTNKDMPESQIAYSTVVSKPQKAYSTVVSKPQIAAYNSAVSSGLKPETPLAYSTTRAEYKLYRTPDVRRTTPIQRKDVPYTMPPTVSSVQNPASRKDLVPNTHADNRYRTWTTRVQSMAAIPEYGTVNVTPTGRMVKVNRRKDVPYDDDMFMARQFSQRGLHQAYQPYFQNGRLSCSSQYGWQPTSTINPL